MPAAPEPAVIEKIRPFAEHWALVERVSTPVKPLVVLDDFGRADLSTLEAALSEAVEAVQAAAEEVKSASEEVKTRRRVVLAGMKRVNRWVRADFPRSPWERVLVWVPGPAVAFEQFVEPIRATLQLWRRIEKAVPGAQPPPYVGGPPFPRAQMEADYDAFEAAWEAWVDAQCEHRFALATRTMLEERAIAVLKAYGHAVKARLGDDAPLARSLPQLWPGPRRGSRRKAKAATAPPWLTPPPA